MYQALLFPPPREVRASPYAGKRGTGDEASTNLWQSQVENERYSTVSGLIRLVISLECFNEITPDFLCPFMNDRTTCTVNFRATAIDI